MGSSPDSFIQCQFTLRLSERLIDASVRLPARPVTADEMLPLLRSLTDTIVLTTLEQAESQGATPTCRRGCAACCCQPVPISPAEARDCALLVAELEPAHRARVEQRFHDALEELEACGLAEPSRNLLLVSGLERSTEFGLRYHALGVPCPFLEDDACSIYARRPLVCREYVVTSPAEECRHPSAERVRTVPLPGEPSELLYRFEDGCGEAPPEIMTLTTALEWVAQHPELPPACVPGPQFLENFVRRLARPPG